MIGVGAAFDMLAGRVRVAPEWMQRTGLEWVFRLAHEPRRLWRRYTRHNLRFVALVLQQRLRGKPALIPDVAETCVQGVGCEPVAARLDDEEADAVTM